MNSEEYAHMLNVKRDSIRAWKRLADDAQDEADWYREKEIQAELELSQMMEARYLQNVVREGEQALASGEPMVTLDDVLESKPLTREDPAYYAIPTVFDRLS
jgi:hypothetical protein